jgi:hypothetical protein
MATVAVQVSKDRVRKANTSDSWTVLYWDCVHSDARKIGGLWRYRDMVSGKYRVFSCQEEVRPRFRNSPKPTA